MRDLIDKGQHKEDTIEAVKHAAMTGKEFARIFDPHLAFQHADREIAQQSNNAAKAAEQNTAHRAQG